MNQFNRRRIEKLEKALMVKSSRPRIAMVCYDSSTSDFDECLLEIDAEIVFIMPDNGMRCFSEECISKDSYKITYSY